MCSIRAPDIDRARDLIGYEPLTSFEDGLRLTLDWWKESDRASTIKP